MVTVISTCSLLEKYLQLWQISPQLNEKQQLISSHNTAEACNIVEFPFASPLFDQAQTHRFVGASFSLNLFVTTVNFSPAVSANTRHLGANMKMFCIHDQHLLLIAQQLHTCKIANNCLTNQLGYGFAMYMCTYFVF